MVGLRLGLRQREKEADKIGMKYKNGVKSAFWGVFQQIITLIFGLIVPRLFIRTFGSEVNGLLSSLGNLFGYLALVEAGVGTAAIQALYGPVGRDDKEEINGIMSAAGNFYGKAGWVYLAGVIAIAIFYPLTVTTTVPPLTIFILTVLHGAGGVINFWVQGKYMLLFQAEGKKYLMSIMTLVVYVTQNIMKIVLLFAGYDVVAIHIGYFCISLCQMVFYLIYIRRNYKWLDFHAEPNKKALNQSGAVFVQQITWMICSNTDILVLTYVAQDLKAVSVYAVYLMVFGTVERLFSNFFGSFHYMLGQKFNVDREGYLAVHSIYEALSMTISFALYAIAFVLTTPFMKVYTAGITDVAYVDKYLPFLFTFMHMLSSSREASSRVINFAGHFKQMQGRAILEAVINLVVSVFAVYKLGIYGVLIGTIVAYLYRTNDIIIYANRKILNRSCWATYRKWLINMAVFGLIWLASRYIDLTVSGFAGFFLVAIPTGIAICILYFVSLWLFERDSARYLLNMGKGAVRKVLRRK